MSVQSQIDRINENVASTYNVLEEAGAEMPQTRNSNNLPGTAASISAVLYGKEQTLTEAQKAQVRKNIGAQAELTGAELESIVQQVITALGTPVFGRVDSEKNIITTGDLADGTYTYWYEGADGKLVEIGTITVGEGRLIGVNLIPYAINADETEYVGDKGEDGYREGYRLNSSGTETQRDYMFATGFLPVETGDTISLDKVWWTANNGTYNYHCYLILYDEYFEKIGFTTADQFKSSVTTIEGLVSGGVFSTYDAGDGQTYAHLKRFKIDAAGAKYLRMSSHLISGSSVIMVNEP